MDRVQGFRAGGGRKFPKRGGGGAAEDQGGDEEAHQVRGGHTSSRRPCVREHEMVRGWRRAGGVERGTGRDEEIRDGLLRSTSDRPLGVVGQAAGGREGKQAAAADDHVRQEDGV